MIAGSFWILKLLFGSPLDCRNFNPPR